MLIGTTLTMPIPIQCVSDVQTVLLKKKMQLIIKEYILNDYLKKKNCTWLAGDF